MRIVYFGTSRFAVPPLMALLRQPGLFEVVAVVTRPDQPVGRKQVLTACPVAEAARAAALPTLTPTNLKDEALLAQLRDYQADFFVVAAYGRIIPATMLAIPRLGNVNLHGSLLPAYRGASPMQAALAAGDTVTGVTLMGVDEEMDHGPIFSTVSVPIEPGDDFNALEAKMAVAGAELLVSDLPRIAGGELQPKAQAHEAATYTRIIKKEDGLIDWKASTAEAVHNRARAYSAWPGIYAYWHRRGQALRLVIRETAITKKTAGLAAGAVFRDVDGTPAVACVDGAVRLVSLQPEGKPAMPGKAFLNGYSDLVGSELSSFSSQNS
jgi:methionyl-tRNA formyltransferase